MFFSFLKSRVNFTLKLISLSFFLTSANLAALTLSEISAIDSQIKQLPNQSDKGLSQIPSLVEQLNTAETSNNTEREKPNPNTAELDEVLGAILNSKMGLTNHIYEYKLYNYLQSEMQLLAAGTDKTAIVHKSISLNILLAGPNAGAESFFVTYLNSDEIGGLRLREALMYFTLHPNNAVKDRASFFASEKGHPIFRGPASWVFGKLSTIDNTAAIAQLTAALNQSIIDNYGFDTQLLTLLGLAEVANISYLKANFSNVGLDKSLLELGERYINFKRASGTNKSQLISNTFNKSMTRYERDEALGYILKNNKADLLTELGLLFDTDNGLVLSPELAQLANIYGYQINGSADNPIISAK
ncbi:hypothetical protein [Pseudoalteromonas sp. BSi20495]|uniref:hypothetical protein n=1 Tax=Pseudoalteromonas sp. BSi20495 TaxID=386429 RepID=UPI0002315F64|nr:hypothetical protein [Pseudoalteromonas sp. BSi20495]GAA81840.1 hypothetical protein P20495_4384 [Pseudoalteromonas sp. BSi20495]